MKEPFSLLLIVAGVYMCVSVPHLQETSGTNNNQEDEEEVLDEETLRKDQGVKGSIEVLIREYANELNAPSQDPDSQPRNKKRKEKKEEVWSRCSTSAGNDQCSLLLVSPGGHQRHGDRGRQERPDIQRDQ